MKKLDLANPKLALVPLCMIGLCGMLFLTGCDTSAAGALVSGAAKGQSAVASSDDANGANQAPATAQAPAPGATDYDDGNTNYDDGATDYDDATDYDGNSVYESGDSLYDDSWDDGNSGYDDVASAYVAPAPAPAASAPAVSAPATGNSGYSNYDSDSGYDADSGYDSDSGYDD